MKKLFVLLSLAGLLCSTSCSETYDDSALTGRVDDLENRVARLEELCRQMNTNIASLQTLVSALQDHDCITSMTPVESGGSVIGYTIAFSQHAPVTIYHGRNGADGVDGKDGAAPVIGVKQDTDGAYYWTLDGEWLTDEAGARIRTQGPDGEDGAPGQDGSDGADGKDGQDGVTPRLKIENEYWYVSYDEGKNWTQLGKAVGDSGLATPGDSMFRSVDASHADYVLFTLTNGTEIRVPKFGALAIKIQEGYEVLFDIGETKTLHYTVSGVDKDAAVVVKAEMLNADDCYTLRTEPQTATSGTITVKTDIPNTTQIIVSVSDGKQSIMVAVRVGIRPVFDEKTVTVATPGTLASLLAGYDKTTITELSVLGNLNSSDISTLKSLPNLAVLDLENVNLEKMPNLAFSCKESLKSIKLPKTLKTIGHSAFASCRGLTGNLVIPASVTSIGLSAFERCDGLTGNLVIPASVTSISYNAFNGCSGFTAVYCKAITPPIANSGAFINVTSKPLYVPVGCADAYRAADVWKEFTNINEK